MSCGAERKEGSFPKEASSVSRTDGDKKTPRGEIIAKHIVVLLRANNFSREGSGALHSLGESRPGGRKTMETIILMNPGAPVVGTPLKAPKHSIFIPSISCPGSPSLALGF